MDTCTVEFARLSRHLGGLRCDGNPFMTLRSPLSLQSWTMPVIELTLVLGAIACLVHAVHWRRSYGDSSNLVVWISGMFCPLLFEPITYFPHWFGLEHSWGLVFVHNQFSVQFLYDRLPLYIVAMYPVYVYVAYSLVQRTGIFSRYSPVIGATCVAFVFHCLYEVVDTVGPQLRWWVWNQDLPSSVPALGVVPLVNIQGFSLGVPFGLALVTLLVSKRVDASGRRVARHVVLVCVLTWPIQIVPLIPATVIHMAGVSIVTARFVETWLLIVVMGLVTFAALIGIYRARRRDPGIEPDSAGRDRFVFACVAVYLAVAVAVWSAALPDYLAARDGVTHTGAPVGSLPYAIVTFVLSIVLTTGVYLVVRPPRADRLSCEVVDSPGPQRRLSY
jgi:hypothetical protein